QAHRNPGFENVTTYHPTFLYESLWCIGVGLLVLWADRRFRLGGGRAFWLYVAAYTAGRGWIESLRVDNAHRFFGLRLNDYVSVAVFVLAVVMLIRLKDRHSDDPDELASVTGPVAPDDGEDSDAEAPLDDAPLAADGADEPAAESLPSHTD
ncbi:MAG: hypothetical protein QOG52_2672, partial [Frankiaceae bacterium]|nr:hypothetical protein [Frankiaceae bacterium]